MISREQIDNWLTADAEHENLEFKTAANSYRKEDVARYSVGIGNVGGGWLVLGLTDKPPRQVVGTTAFESQNTKNKLKSWVFSKLGIEIDVFETKFDGKRVVGIQIPSRPIGRTFSYEDGQRLIRRGEELVAMSDDRLKQILTEAEPEWSELPAAENCSSSDVVELLDTQTFFELIHEPYPSTRESVLERLAISGLVHGQNGSWAIPNFAAIALAKRLNAFSEALASKAPRFIVYEGTDKRVTRNEVMGIRGYAVGFAGLVTSVHDAGPDNRFNEQLIRDERKMFPKNALRELIANALVHQDFDQTGLSVRIELYSDRLELMSPGSPIVETKRFVDEDKSRNEQLAKLFARLGLCERKGSGIDKVMFEVEFHQLPAPNFRGSASRTNVALFAYRPFSEMGRDDRIRACYLHCCLQHVGNRKTNNSSLRERFGLASSSTTTSQISQVLRDTREEELIRIDSEASSAPRYARYLPYWA